MNNSHIEKSREFLKKKHDKAERQRLKLYDKACSDFTIIVNHIIETYNPRRIYQWGSLLEPDKFREYSDIDIALEGITSAEEFFSILNTADDLTSFKLDIVQLEKIHPLHAQSIREKGKLIYEAGK